MRCLWSAYALYISLWKTLTTELLLWLQTSWGDSGHEKVIEVIFLVQSRIPAQHEFRLLMKFIAYLHQKGEVLWLYSCIILMNTDIDVPGRHSFVVTCDWEVVHYKKAIVISTSHLLSEFKMSEHHVWTENSVNRLFKNSKTHYCNWHSWLIACDANGKVRFRWRGDCCNVLWTLKQSVTELAVHALVGLLACLLLIACHANGNGHVWMERYVIGVMCFELLNNLLFTELTVHVCNMFTHQHR